MKTLSLPTVFAVLSGVRGSLPALETVLADVERRGLPPAGAEGRVEVGRGSQRD